MWKGLLAYYNCVSGLFCSPDLTFSRGSHSIGDITSLIPCMTVTGLDKRVEVAVVNFMPCASWSEFTKVYSLMRIGNVLFVVHHFKPILTGILSSQVSELKFTAS
jgi:hypothetical protein